MLPNPQLMLDAFFREDLNRISQQVFFSQDDSCLYKVLVILIRVDAQAWDKVLRKKARYMNMYKPKDFGLESYLNLDPAAKLTRSRMKMSILDRNRNR